MEVSNIINNERKDKLIRLSLLIFSCLLILIFLNLANIYSIGAVLIIALGYVFLRQQLGLVLCLAIPALAFGQVLKFPVGWQWGYEASIAEILLIFIFIIFLLDKFINKKIGEIKVDLVMILLSAYLLVSLFSFWWAIDLRYYIFGLKVSVFSFLAYFLFYNLIREKSLRLFLDSLLITVLILSGEILIKFYEMGWSAKILFDRSNIIIAFGPLATASAVLVFLLPITVAYYFSTPVNNKIKPFIFITFALGSLAVFLTLGKAAILSFIVGLFYFFLKFKSKRKIFIISLVVFMVLGAIIFSSFASGLIKRISTTFIDVNSKFRVLEYRVGWELIKDHPLFGVGAGQQLFYFKKMLNYETTNLVNNFFLQAFIDYGIIGLGLVVFMVISVFRKAIRAIKQMGNEEKNKILFYGFTAALIVSFINGLLEVTYFALPYAIIFWGTAGVIERNITPLTSGSNP